MTKHRHTDPRTHPPSFTRIFRPLAARPCHLGQLAASPSHPQPKRPIAPPASLLAIPLCAHMNSSCPPPPGSLGPISYRPIHYSISRAHWLRPRILCAVIPAKYANFSLRSTHNPGVEYFSPGLLRGQKFHYSQRTKPSNHHEPVKPTLAII